MPVEHPIVAILATHGFEQSELVAPQQALCAAGLQAKIVAPAGQWIRGVRGKTWADDIAVDLSLDATRADAFDALLLPGGVYNPDALRQDARAVAFVRAMVEAGKPVAAICHGPWLLIEADVVRGRRVTGFPSLKTDLIHAGAEWVDQPVVEDGPLITSRSPDDLDAFGERLVARIQQTRPDEAVTDPPPDCALDWRKSDDRPICPLAALRVRLSRLRRRSRARNR